MEPRILLLLLTVAATRGEDTCSRDDVACGDEDLGQRLARIEKLSSVNLNRAYEEIKVLALAEPEQPRVLFLLARLQRDLYLKLHVKMRDVGKPELLHPSIEHLKKILSMPSEQVSDEFHAEVADFAETTAMATANKTLSVQLLEAMLKRTMNPVIGLDKYRVYFELLVEELFYAQDFKKSLEMMDNIKQMFKPPHMEINFIRAVIGRYNEIVNKQPFVVSHDLLKKVKLKTDDDKRSLIGYVGEMEEELRRLKRQVEVDIVFEVAEELGLYPSKYQRPNMLVDGLRAAPVWQPEHSGYWPQLGELVDNWAEIRTEIVNLTDQLEDWEWRASPQLDKYDLYYFLGDGVVQLPAHGCEVAPTFCGLLSAFNVFADCVLCEVKILYFEPRAQLRPTVGPTNAKLTALFPINLGNSTTLNQGGSAHFRVRVGDQTVEWTERKPAVIDGSFEHEIVNQSTRARMLLMVDFKHPDMTPEDDFLDPSAWDISEVQPGTFVYSMKNFVS